MHHTILVVDDNPSIRRLIRSCVERSTDWEVCGEAENGLDGIQMAWELHPDLIVMDLSMPVMNGIEAAQVLHGSMPSVPLIIFSGYSDVLSPEEARAAGIRALVSKSENISVLVGTARDVLSDRAA